MGDLRLSKEQLVERYGEGVLETLPRGKRTVYSAQSGVDIDIVADLFGFKNGDELVQALERMPNRQEAVSGTRTGNVNQEAVSGTRTGSARNAAIEAETDRVMIERHGDVLTDGRVEQEALQAVHNDKRGEWLAAELKAVTEVAGLEGVPTARQAKAFASKSIAQMQVGRAVKAHVFLTAERRAGNQAAKLGAQLARQKLWQQAARRRLAKAAKGTIAGEVSIDKVSSQIDAANMSIENYNETVAKFVRAKQSQLLNHALYVESVAVGREMESALRRVGRLTRAIAKIGSGRKKLGETEIAGDYVEPIEAILEAYEFRKVSGNKLNKREALLSFVEKMESEGRANELAIPDSVMEDAKQTNYQNLSVEHVRGVVDALKNIEHMARLKGKLLMGKRRREFDEAKGVLVDGLEKNLKQVDVEWIKKQGIGESIKSFGRTYLALAQNSSHILRRIDGRQDLGPVYELLKTPLDEASFGERRDRTKAGEDIRQLMDVYGSQEQRQMAVAKTYDELGGRSFSKWNLIAMALNMGNEGNLSRLTNKKARQHLKAQEVEAVKRLLDKRDWDFVQSVWDYLDTWKTKIAERDRRLRGIEPQWVEAQAVVTPHGTYRGGYYPIKYDGDLGGNRRAVTDGDEDIVEAMMRGSYASATTKQGHLKARIGAGAQSLSLDTSVISKHVMEVIHDLHFNEPVVGAWRLLNNNDVEAAFLKANMKEAYEALKLWVQDVASGQIIADSKFARGANKLRSGFTISKLAYNVYTVVQQPLGLGQSAEMVGARNLAAAMLDYSKDMGGTVAQVLEKSNIMWERRDTFNKDLMDATAKANLASPKSGKVKTVVDDYIVPLGLYGLVWTQFHTVDVPTWMAAYRKGLKQFDGLEDKAVHYADMVVSSSQASGLFLDRSAFERGTWSAGIRQNPLILLMTTLGSYFFAKQNRVIERTQGLLAEKITFGRAMEYAYHMAQLLLLEAAVIQTVKYALSGGDDDDDDESLIGQILLGGLENYLSGVPVVRDMVGAAKGYDAGTYAALSNTFVKPLMRAVEGKFDGSFTKGTVNAIGTLTRLPSTQTNRALDGLFRTWEDEDVSMMEVIFGRSYK